MSVFLVSLVKFHPLLRVKCKKSKFMYEDETKTSTQWHWLQNLRKTFSFLFLSKQNLLALDTFVLKIQTLKTLWRSSYQRCSVKQDILKNFANLSGKQLWKRQILEIFKNICFEEHLLMTAFSSGFYNCCEKQLFMGGVVFPGGREMKIFSTVFYDFRENMTGKRHSRH